MQINTARYELSLARHLPAPVSGVPQLVAIKTLTLTLPLTLPLALPLTLTLTLPLTR